MGSTPYLVEKISFCQPPLVPDYRWLHQKYVKEGLTVAQIAKNLGCSKTTVKTHLKADNISKKKQRIRSRCNLAYGEKLIKGKPINHQAELRVIATIIKMHRNEGIGVRAIARLLNTMKVPTKQQGKKWNHETIRQILKRHGRISHN